MKLLLKTIAFAIAVFPAIPGFSQMMPDSTVQICAYWQPGDKYSYLSKETQYKVDEKNDTTVVKSESEVFTFEVLSQTKDSYHLSLTYSDFQSSEEDEMKLTKAMEDVIGQCVIEFKTNEFGTLKSFSNLQTVAEKMTSAVDIVIENMYSEDKDLKKVIPKKKMRDYLIANTCTPQAIMTTVLDDIGRLFFFHGARLDTVSTYTMDEKFASVLTGTDSLDCKTNFWVDRKYTDEYSAVCRTFSEPADTNHFVNMISTLLSNTVSELLPVPKKSKGQIDEAFGELSEKMTASFEQYTTEEVHLDTGWFLNYYYDRFVKISAEGKSKETIISRSIELLD